MKLWQELRRRRLFRLAGIYIVGAWVAIQVGDTFFPAWEIPDTALRYLIIAAVLGFPIAMVFGWFYDITAEGIVRTTDASAAEDLSLKRSDFVILGALAVVAIAVVYGSVEKVRETTDDYTASFDKPANSIAVLPFDNLGDEDSDEYFSAGMTEEILHQLGTFDALSVMGRASSFAFKGADLSIPETSDILRVRYLLQGSVRRQADRIRVTASLVDERGFQVWTDTFDRELTNVFAIQSDIANSVAGQLVEEIAPREIATARTTDNVEAYQEYLVGREYVNRRTPGWQDRAAEAFERALELDPDFALAHADYAVALAISGDPRKRAEAQRRVDIALELDPEVAEAHAVQGLILSFGFDADLEAAEAALRRAIELDPNLVIAYNWLATVVASQERGAEAMEIQEQGLALDPLNPILVTNLAGRYDIAGDFRRAEELLLRLMELPEPPGTAYWELYSLYGEYGRLDTALQWGKEVVGAYGPSMKLITYGGLAAAYERLGMQEAADYWLEQGSIGNPYHPRVIMWRAYILKFRGQYDVMRAMVDQYLAANPLPSDQLSEPLIRLWGAMFIATGKIEQGIELIESIIDLDTPVRVTGEGGFGAIEMLQILAWGHQQTGNAERATEILAATQGYLETWLERGTQTPSIFEFLAANYVMQGDYDAAHAALERGVDAGWRNYGWILHDHRWQPVIDEPKFRSLFSWVQADIDRQRARVEATDAAEDFGAEILQLHSN